jgi:hypothetical protein
MTDAGTIAKLEPDFGLKIQAFKLRLLKDTGFEWYACQGLRTIAGQDALFAQGRTAPGKVCTRARGGQSAHNFGLAADMAPVKNGELWWEAPRDLWKEYADIAKDMGLVPGFYFQTIFDPDHVEDPNWKAQQALWKAGKITVA